MTASRRTATLAIAFILLAGSVVSAPNSAAQTAWCAGRNGDVGGQNSIESVKKNYPVLSTDEFDVVFLDGCALEKRWDASAGGTDISLWQTGWWIWQAYPSEQGWRSPGDLPVAAKGGSDFKLDPPENYATFIIRGRKASSITSPDSYSKIFDDDHTKGTPDISLYEPKCPSGYDALGLVSKPRSGSGPDTLTNGWVGKDGKGIACVIRNLTYKMQASNKGPRPEDTALWNTKTNMRGSADISFYGVARPPGATSVKNTIVVPAPTFWAKKDSYDAPSQDKFRGLQLPIAPPKTTPSALQPPVMTEGSVLGLTPQEKSESLELNGLVVVDEQYYASDIAKLRQSPVYRVELKTTWVPVDQGHLCDKVGQTCEVSYAIERTSSESTTWNNAVGISVGRSVELSAEPAGMGVAVTTSLELSYTHEFGGESQTGSGTTNTDTRTLQPGEFGAFFQARTAYKVYRKNSTNDSDLVRQYTVSDGPVAFAVYRPARPVNSDCTKTGADRNLENCPLPVTASDSLPRGKQVFSESKGHYLLLTKGGTLQVRKSNQGVAQSKGALWRLDTDHPYGRFGHEITDVSFKDGRLQVIAANSDTAVPDKWCSTTETHPDAQLEITDDGVLRVVDVNDTNNVYWTSEFDSEEDKGEC